jgi:hypothetical protein
MYGCIELLCTFPWQETKALKALIELKNAQQFADERRRRWFSSTNMDLIVWYDESDSIAGFELYYDKNIKEHVLIWEADSGFAHLAVDDGEQKPVLDYKEAPILIPDGHVDPTRIRNLFEGSRENLPAEVATLVLKKLVQYPDT